MKTAFRRASSSPQARALPFPLFPIPFPLLFCALAILTLRPAAAADNRLYMAAQYDFGAKTGFYLDFENATKGDAPASLSTLRLILGVADGKSWRFLSEQPPLEYDRDYTATGILTPKDARLELDGKTLATGDIVFQPDRSALVVNDSPGWARAPAEYLIEQKSVRLTVQGQKPLQVNLASAPPLPVLLFGGVDTRRFETWRVSRGQSLTVQVVFRLHRRPADLRPLSPFIDGYGQSRHATWPGKIGSDADLKQAAEQEAQILKGMPPSAGYDPFGGYRLAGWHGKATGYYTVARHGSRWWLISPQGNPTFYTGICTAPSLAWDTTPVTGREYLFESLPPRSGPTAAAWGENSWGSDPGIASLAFHSLNMLRKYGPEWKEVERNLTVRRTHAFGFSGLGKFCDIMPGIPSIPVLGYPGVPKLVRHPDIFDPAIQASLRESLRKQIQPQAKNPYIVGWSIGNEYDEIITPDEVREILKRAGSVPAKRALVDYAVDSLYEGDAGKAAQAAGVTATGRDPLYAAPLTLPDPAIESLRRFYADRYYDFLYRTVKEIDPDHLYLGFWIAFGWWVNEEDWRLIGRHCDVLGYDRYAYSFSNADLDRLTRDVGKPILCGEFSFPPGYHGQRGFGFYPSSTEDEEDAARYYTRWLKDAATNPYCVGVGWFQYRDEPLTGRGPGHGPEPVIGEDFAFGLVDVADRPKWTLVRSMRQANLSAVKQRLEPPARRGTP